MADTGAKSVKSYVQDVLESLLSVSKNIPQGAKDFYKISKETQSILDKVVNSGPSTSSAELAQDGNIKIVRQVSEKLSIELGALSQKTENWWLEVSGENTFDKKSSTTALTFLTNHKRYLLKLKEACVGLNALAHIVHLKSVAFSVKGFVNSHYTTLKGLDEIATDDSVQDCQECIKSVDLIIKKIDAAYLVIADMDKPVDRNLVVIHAKDKRSAYKAVYQSKVYNQHQTAQP